MNYLNKAEERFGAAQGTIVAMFAALAVKGIGALYKIPLYNILGDYATGVYGMVFPLFAFLLCLSGGGLPAALTKMIADGYSAKKVFKKTVVVVCVVGGTLSVLLFVFADKIARFQGNADAGIMYKAIAPSVFIVGLIAVFRGYFQGLSDMRLTAVSQMIEQVVRAVIGLIGALLLPISQIYKAFFAVLCITFSEIIALVYCFMRYKKRNKTMTETAMKEPTFGVLFSYLVPLVLSAVLIPLSGVAEGFIAMRALGGMGEIGTSYYGLYVGATETIISLPAAVLYPLASGFLPAMKKNGNAEKCLIITFFGAFCAAVFAFLFPDFIISLLFSRVRYKAVLKILLKLSSLTMLLLPVLQCVSHIMLSMGAQKRSLLNNALGCAVKISVCALLVGNPSVHVFALAISDICCYFVALSSGLLYIIIKNKSKGSITDDNVGRTGYDKGRLVVKSF